MNILKSKKGNTLTREELLSSLQSANAEKNLSILYKEGKPTLVHKYNEQGPLEMITASVIFPMLLSKFIIEKSEAYTIASWLSENFSNTQEPEETKSIDNNILEFLEMLSSTTNTDRKQTKAELIQQLSNLNALIEEQIDIILNK